MRTTLSTLDLRQQLGDILDRVALRHDQFVIERKGKPLAAVVPITKLEQMERFAREQALATLQRLPKATLSASGTMALADEAKHSTRKPGTRPTKGR
jgi:prevent-host-death family protein